MKIISDLHVHSRFSRATSKELNIANLEKWAKIKGLNLIGTGDFTHPEWIKELKNELTEDSSRILKTKTKFPFVLQTEISLIYTQSSKGRRIHNIVLAPDFDVVDQITEVLKKRGRVDYDGRPIFNIPCPDFVEMMTSISKDIEVIPAHCLLPGTYIHSNPKLKKIEEIKKNDKVLTHNGRFKKVLKTYKRFYKGKTYKITPWYFREGLTTTSEHPFYVIKSFKNCSWIKGTCKPCSQINCKKKIYKTYSPEWVQAENLEKGDFLIYPRIKVTKNISYIKIYNYIKEFNLNGAFITTKGSRTKRIKNCIKIDKNFCRLAGYYLAEGFTVVDEAIGFSFNKKEKEYIEDVINLMKLVFGISPTKIDYRKGADIIFYSHILNRLFKKLFYSREEKRAWNKSIPKFMLFLPKEKQSELLRGWWRGDRGYTVSHELANQMKIICIRLGIIPSISRDSAKNFNVRGKHFIGNRKISTNRNTFIFSNLSFFEGKELLKDKSFEKFINKRNRKHGWMDKNYIYLPIRKIEKKDYEGDVYNLEIEEDNSYVSEFVTVHNCWTPWFSLFGANSGFDSIKECFKDQTKNIHALESGLSSDPAMNRRLSQLDDFAIVSFSDLHSFWPWRIGRESTIFDLKELSYKELIKALRNKKITETIEFWPHEGKYHYTGHRLCNVCLSPKEALKLKDICPKCGKKLTVGVAERVEMLADRPDNFKPKGAVPFKNLIPLSELISGIVKADVCTKKVWHYYNKLIDAFENEMTVLLNAEKSELNKIVPEKITDIIIKNRNQKIHFRPGFDGVYGKPIFDEKESDDKKMTTFKFKQTGIFDF